MLIKKPSLLGIKTLALLAVLTGCTSPQANATNELDNLHRLPAELTPFTPSAYKAQQTHQSVTVQALGEGENRVYVFLPNQPSLPTNQALPVVFLHHGWLGTNPMNFGALIDHLARSGHAVIYPTYQTSDATNPQTITQNAVNADKQALKFLQQQGYQLDNNRVLYVGFSMGSAISLNIASSPTFYGLPKPKGMVLMAPGDAYHVKKGDQAKSIISDIKKIPSDIPIAVITGDADTSIGVPTARLVAKQLCHLPVQSRSLLLLPSDSHDTQTVKSGHGSVGSPDSRYNFELTDYNFPRVIQGTAEFEPTVSLNQLDFYGYWRVITTLNDSLAKGGKPVVVGAGDNIHSLPLGLWADGTAFKPMQVEHPCATF